MASLQRLALMLVMISAGAAATVVNATDSSRRTIPLCAGLTIVTAVSQPEGDYESIKTIQSVTDKDVALKYSSEQTTNGIITKMTAYRTMLRDDLKSATLYQHRFFNRSATTIPGTTAIGTSAAVLRALKVKGEADLGLFDSIALAMPVDREAHPNMYDYQMVEKVQRVGTQPVLVETMVDGDKVQLPAVQAKGDYTGDKAEFFFLDNESNPMSLRYKVGRDALNVVKISTRCTGELLMSEADRLDAALSALKRAEVYSIYFSFNSDLIREESAPTLKAIAEVMRRHPDWTLAVDGHTDDIGSDAYNLALSRGRALAVKKALLAQYGIADQRITTDGFGKSRPKDVNDTLEGRARNRRVELTRIK